jgi:plasmid stabilization system protein ParE
VIPVRWTEQAADDLVAIHAFFARDSPAYARTIAEHVYQAVGQLRTFPDSGRAIRERHDPALRELVVRGYRIA